MMTHYFSKFISFAAATSLCFSAMGSTKTLAADKQYNAQELSDAVIILVNKERKAAGLNPLQTAPLIHSAANTRANELVQMFQHYRPDKSLYTSALYEVGLTFTFSGENIAAGAASPESVVKLWMSDDGHKDNILSPDYNYIGVSVAYSADSEYGWYWTQDFIYSSETLEGSYTPVEYVSPKLQKCDVNADNCVDTFDITALRKYINNSTSSNLSASQLAACDFNGDGNITNADLTSLNMYIISQS